MTRGSVSVVGTVVVGLGLAVATGFAERGQTAGPAAPPPAQTASPRPAVRPTRPVPAASHLLSPALSAREQSDLVKTYCATCHSDRAKAGGLSLAGFDAMKAHEQQDVVEKMIRKLSAGLMPPPGAKRPEAALLGSLTSALEGRMDEYAAANPNPGRRTFQRLNRPEYERAIADLLALDVDHAQDEPAGDLERRAVARGDLHDPDHVARHRVSTQRRGAHAGNLRTPEPRVSPACGVERTTTAPRYDGRRKSVHPARRL